MTKLQRDLLILTTIRDEGPFLVEWITHHKALGATGFLIYSNACSDGSDVLLDRLAEAGEVVHLRNEPPEGSSVQWHAYKAAWSHARLQAADWVLPMDCDEFVNLRPPYGTFWDLIDAAEADAILLPWRFFGHSGQAFFAPRPVTERFTQAAPPFCPLPATATSFKTLFRREGPFKRLGIHRPKSADGTVPVFVDGALDRLGEAFSRASGRIMRPGLPIANAAVQLNHYSVRSIEDFLVKRQRGLPNRADKPIDAAYWAERNFNMVEDRSIARHRAATAEAEARLRALPGVAEAEADCIARHRAAIARAFEDPDEARLFGRLLLLPGSVPPPLDLAEEALRRFQAAQARSKT